MSVRRSGFTLVEVLVALAILGILAVIAAPSYMKYVARGRQADAKTQLTAIRQAQEIYKLQHGTYTTGTGALSGWKSSQGRYTFSVTSATTTAFTAQASGNIDGDATTDVWTMNQDGTLTNVTNDTEN
jgi:prepilin-type N-terminal cleavage/methylation domain-containing protein